MKQLWSAVILLAVMSLLLTWNGGHITERIQPFQENLDQAVLAAKAGDWNRTEELTRQVQQAWKEGLSYLYLVQSHRDVDEITILLEEALEYTESQSTNTYSAVNVRIQGLMEGLVRIESLSVSNLL
ncbi:MAG: DUF4363 family protein [Ruminiclostridium sp.]|nr:DUF4363 family protein [Ruminiclostridium sp.]